jgi:hypothetical protein
LHPSNLQKHNQEEVILLTRKSIAQDTTGLQEDNTPLRKEEPPKQFRKYKDYMDARKNEYNEEESS